MAGGRRRKPRCRQNEAPSINAPETIITVLKMVAEGSSITLSGGAVAPRSLISFCEVV